MKKIRVGIVGYGNLGKCVEEKILSDDSFRLVAIFSRRNVSSFFGTVCDKFENINNYKRKIDIMFLCGGSKTDTETQAMIVAKNFDTIDSFDNHAHISKFRKELNDQNIKNKRCSIVCCGWDPGLFSLVRALFEKIDGSHETFWGKGVSQGHSQALRSLFDVEDAIQFTIPSKRAMKLVEKGESVDSKEKHIRLCYVAAKKGANKKELRKAILAMPDYFEGYRVKIKFCKQQKINKLKQNMFHKGFVTTLGGSMRFELNLPSNPQFTAGVLVCYSKALTQLKRTKSYGAKTIAEIPVSYLFQNTDEIINLC